MSWQEMAFASTVVLLGATVQASIGFGLNVVAAPFLVLIDTDFVPGPALVAALVLTVLVARRDWSSVDRAGFGWVFVGRVPGTVAGALAITALPTDAVAFILAGAVLLAVALSVRGWRVRRFGPTLVGAGAMSGLMGTISSVGGPPVALLYQDAKGSEVRGTLSAMFSVGALFSIVMLAVVGRFGTHEANASLVLLPAVFAGYVASRWTGAVLDRGYVRPAILTLCVASAIAAAVRYAL